MSTLERRQLQNNIILSGLPEETFGGLKNLKSKGIETISCAFSDYSKEEAIRKANVVTVIYCRRIGKYEVNKTRPIAITFLNHEDQEYILKMKKSLPTGIYIDEEYPSEVRKIRAKLHPIFTYATQLDSYKGKCKLLYDSHSNRWY